MSQTNIALEQWISTLEMNGPSKKNRLAIRVCV
jgi:hypothetical protein